MSKFIGRLLKKVRYLDTGCWEWLGGTNDKGSGRCSFEGRIQPPHRVLYEFFYGKIESNLTIDHLCRNRICVNPKHLEAVTLRENILRSSSFSAINAKKTHCYKGHPFTGDNLKILSSTGERRCRTCINKNAREYQRRLRLGRKESV